MFKLVCCVMALLVVAACTSQKQTVLKSPCVGTDDSPCGPKRYLNKTQG
jgi:hypothetical protein